MVESIKPTKTATKKQPESPQKKKKVFALPPPEADLAPEGEVVAPFAIQIDCKALEQVGTGYEKLKKKVQDQLAGTYVQEAEPVEEESKGTSPGKSSGSDGSDNEGGEHDDWKRKKKTKTKEDIEREALLLGDLYGLLNLEHLTYSASKNDIKKQYNKLALVHHPDKCGENFGEAEKDLWLKIQNAYETLMDEPKRKKYDSSLPFDERLPEEKDVTDANFYETFEPIFKNNARFANKKPVPNLGAADLSFTDTRKFYKYWDNFDTWREFSQFHEYDTNDAGDRYERRWMEKENKKISDKHMKKERSRLIQLAQMAYRKDPRIQKELARIEEEKRLAKQLAREKKEAEKAKIQAVHDEIERKKKEEQDRKDEESRIRKQAINDEKKLFKEYT
jgi:DnaJ family protein C protein 2